MNNFIPILSIIVPVYGTEKYLSKCLDSLLSQTLKEIEIIAVNDHTNDNCGEILKQYADKDERIKIVNHETNMGLYYARISGVKVSSAPYIGFVDSDDYVSCDYFRELVSKAESSSSDIVVGKIVHEDENGYRYVHNSYLTYDFGVLTDEEPARKFWEQQGYCFIWHSIWNKIYSRSIWEQALPYLEKQENHIIMTEDFVFSSILFSFAKKLTCVQYGCYFYLQHSGASTSLSGGIKKYQKNIADLKTAFDFVENYLKESGLYKKYGYNFCQWRSLYSRFWCDNIIRSDLSDNDKKNLELLLCDALKQSELVRSTNADSYFYNTTTAWKSGYNDLMNMVCSDDIYVISFDIFDTMVTRPFLNPTDLFEMMDKSYLNDCQQGKNTFSKMRIAAEKSLRSRMLTGTTEKEEVTLDEIYDEIGTFYRIPQDTLRRMEELEIALEIKYASPRNSVKNLITAAKNCGKRIAFTSDMYLPLKAMEEILEKCGYDKPDYFLLSYVEQKTKRTGSLYAELARLCREEPSSILHVGDNWESDYISAQKAGFTVSFYPSVKDCIMYNIPAINTSHMASVYKEPSGSWMNREKSLQFLGVRCALAICAEKLYDNPFLSFSENSEINADPRFLGYFPLGMHLLGIAKWLMEKSVEENYDCIAFIARDGYLPQKALEILRQVYCITPETKYMYMSRKASIACGIETEEDLYSISDYLNINTVTPEFILKLIKPIISCDDNSVFEKNGFTMDKPFSSDEEFRSFINCVIAKVFDKSKAKDYHQKMCDYFNDIFIGNTVVFDVGYSGRTQTLLTKLLNKPINAYYIHKNDEMCDLNELNNGFHISSFYDYTPSITGVAREYLVSEYSPSCIGYDISDTVTPIFEKFAPMYQNVYCINEIQDYSLKFVSDFVNRFGDDMDRMLFRNMDISVPYEYFINNLTEFDSHLFEYCHFEDDMYAGKTFTLSEQWLTDISYHKIIPYYRVGSNSNEVGGFPVNSPTVDYGILLNGKNIIERLFFFLAMDRKLMCKKIMKRFKKHNGDKN